nr:hypothetical protein [uncultured Mucilaginibacter sp.]
MESKQVDMKTLRLIKHDIKNQLSNIQLALETIKHEVSNPTNDVKFCIDTIADSASKIDALVKEMP